MCMMYNQTGTAAANIKRMVRTNWENEFFSLPFWLSKSVSSVTKKSLMACQTFSFFFQERVKASTFFSLLTWCPELTHWYFLTLTKGCFLLRVFASSLTPMQHTRYSPSFFSCLLLHMILQTDVSVTSRFAWLFMQSHSNFHEARMHACTRSKAQASSNKTAQASEIQTHLHLYPTAQNANAIRVLPNPTTVFPSPLNPWAT